MSEGFTGGHGAAQTEQKSVPSLRFPEFDGEWEFKPISERLERVIDYRGKAPPKTEVGVPLITARNVRLGYLDFQNDEYIDEGEYQEWMNRGIPRPYDVLFTTEAPLGNVSYYPRTGVYALGQRIITLRAEDNVLSNHFLFQFLLSPAGRKKIDEKSTGSTAKGIKSREFLKIPFAIPTLPEQKKIAAFLGAVDEKLAALRQRRDLLTRYKRGLMQKLFSQTLRFTRDNGTPYPDWEEKRLGDVFKRVVTKNIKNNGNVLTISAQQGLVNQKEFFNKSVSANDVRGYYLLHKGDFAYNKSYSKGYPMGAVKRLNNYETGVVSTLYICFRSKSETASKFYEQFFESGGLNRELRKIAQEGARNHGLLNMSVVEFFNDITMPFPHPDEQQKIADALQAMDAKIDAVATESDQIETFKKALLQQMFV